MEGDNEQLNQYNYLKRFSNDVPNCNSIQNEVITSKTINVYRH